MAQVCYFCGKSKQIGRQSRHHKGVAGKQWTKRAQKTVKVFKVNLHPKTLDGVRILLCAKCIKKMKGQPVLAKKEASLQGSLP